MMFNVILETWIRLQWEATSFPLRYAKKKKKKKPNTQKTKIAGKDMEKLEFSCIAGGTVKWYSHFGRQFCSSSKS